MAVKLSFSKVQGEDFYTTLNKEVEAYFKLQKLSKNANGLMSFKIFFILYFL